MTINHKEVSNFHPHPQHHHINHQYLGTQVGSMLYVVPTQLLGTVPKYLTMNQLQLGTQYIPIQVVRSMQVPRNLPSTYNLQVCSAAAAAGCRIIKKRINPEEQSKASEQVLTYPGTNNTTYTCQGGRKRRDRRLLYLLLALLPLILQGKGGTSLHTQKTYRIKRGRKQKHYTIKLSFPNIRKAT